MSIERLGPFLALTDGDGCRHVIRINSIQLMSDADPCQDATVVIIAGRSITVIEPMNAVLTAMGPESASRQSIKK